MKLKAVVNSIDEVPEALREYYTEKTIDDATVFVLDLDGFRAHPDATALVNAHERTKTRNRELVTENTELKEKAEQLPEDFDADLYERAKTEGVGGGKEPKNAEQIREEAAAAATKRAEEKAAKELGKVTGERDKYKTQLETRIIRDALDEALEENGVTDLAYRKGARSILRELIVIVEEDGELVALAKDPDVGDTVPVAEHVKTWVGTDEGKAYQSARESGGGGANGSGKGGKPDPNSDENPWKAGKTWNLTRQAEIKNSDPAKAERMKAEAGIVSRA